MKSKRIYNKLILLLAVLVAFVLALTLIISRQPINEAAAPLNTLSDTTQNSALSADTATDADKPSAAVSVYLMPGSSILSGETYVNTLDTVKNTAVKKLTTQECDKIFTENAYSYTATVGADLPEPESVRTDLLFAGWEYIVDGLITKSDTIVQDVTYYYACWRSHSEPVSDNNDDDNQGDISGGTGEEEDTAPPETNTIALYFDLPTWGDTGSVCLYLFNTNDNTINNGAWRGVAATFDETSNKYKMVISAAEFAKYTHYIISFAEGVTIKQTDDMDITALALNKSYTVTLSDHWTGDKFKPIIVDTTSTTTPEPTPAA